MRHALLAVVALTVASFAGATAADQKYGEFLLNIGGKTFQEWNSSTTFNPHVINQCVTILTTWFGVYPCIGCGPSASDPHWCNGGLPQLANLTLHEDVIASDLDEMKVPKDFDGWFVNDYESWHASWNFTSAVYKNASMRLIRSRHQAATGKRNLTDWEVEHKAMLEYDEAATAFLVATLKAVRKARPNAQGYGFYGYPSLYTWWGNTTTCQPINDKLLPLWEVQSGFYPSLYLPYKSNVDVPYARNKLHITKTIEENIRVQAVLRREKNLSSSIVPYTWYRYHPGEPHGYELIDDLDTELEFAYPMSILDGAGRPAVSEAIIWGDESGNKTAAKEAMAWFEKHRQNFTVRLPKGAATVSGGERGQQPPETYNTKRCRVPFATSTRNGLRPLGVVEGSDASNGAVEDQFSEKAIPPFRRCGL